MKTARDEHATAEAALEEFMRSAFDGDQRAAAEDVEKARSGLRTAQAAYAHKQGVLPLARAVQAELGVQGSGRAAPTPPPGWRAWLRCPACHSRMRNALHMHRSVRTPYWLVTRRQLLV